MADLVDYAIKNSVGGFEPGSDGDINGLELQENVRGWAKKNLNHDKSRAMENNHRLDADLIKDMCENQFLSFQIPAKYGGLSLSDTAGNRVLSAVVQEELAYWDASVALQSEGPAGLFGHSVLFGGREDQKELYLPKILSGELIGCFALTEPNAGSDTAKLESAIMQEGDRLRVTGTKQFITCGTTSQVAAWYGITERGEKNRHGAVVISRNEEYTGEGYQLTKTEENLGVRASGTATLMTDSLVPLDNMLNGESEKGTYATRGQSLALKVLDDGRLMIAADAVGMIRRCRDVALQYALERETMGKPIARHQLIQDNLAKLQTLYDATRGMVYGVAWDADQTGVVNTAGAAGAKQFASDKLMEATRLAIDVLGGNGYSEEYPLAKISRDAAVYPIFEGHNKILTLVIATDMIREHAQKL